MRKTRLAAGLVVLLPVAMLGCGGGSDSPTGGSSSLNVGGSWVGTARLPNPYTASMSLQQTGSAVSGTIRIAGAISDGPISGTVNSPNRTFVWTANRGCNIWSGTYNVSADGRQMDGPVLRDSTGCVPSVSNVSGTLEVSRQ